MRSRHPSATTLEDQLLGLVDEYAKEMATKSEKDRMIIKVYVCGFLGKLYETGFVITLPNLRLTKNS